MQTIVIGLATVLENLNVRKLIISKQGKLTSEYERIIEIVKKKNIQVQVVQSGDRIIIDKYTYIDILYPDFKISEKDINNNSIVAKLNYGSFSVLFTGDIEEPAEKYLVGADSISARTTSHSSQNSTPWVKNIFNRKLFKASKT